MDARDGFVVPVEAGHVLQFARATAISGESPSDPPGQESVETDVPPTFLMVADHFDPDFPRRPRADRRDLEQIDRPRFHVEQRIEYSRPIRVGETLRARRLPARRWTKQGRRAGTLEFIEEATEFRDETGAVVASSVWVDVETSQSHSTVSASQEAMMAPPLTDGIETCLVENLTRTQIVMYVGAAGDFHPLHHDEAHAQSRGYPSVFAPGMLTMALSLRPLHRAPGTWLRNIASRFRSQVWPGDSLTARITQDADGLMHVLTINQRGAVVLETSAIIGAT